MDKKAKIKLFILSLALLVLVVFIKINASEEKVITLSINSSYSQKVKMARAIIEKNREEVYIDQEIKVNAVIYDLKLLSNDYDREKTNIYFIKENLKENYINTICKEAGIVVGQEEIDDYKLSMLKDINKCKRDRIALFNGFDSFDKYFGSEHYNDEARIKLSLEKISMLEPTQLAYYIDAYKEDNSKELIEVLDEELEVLYKKYINKRRY